LGTPSPNFKKFGENFVIGEFFMQFTGFGHLTSLTPRATIHGPTQNGENFAFLELSCKNTPACGWVSDFMEIWASKSSKYMQILTFCPYFELQKAILGEMTFEGSNQLQIQKF